ncbi:MAG: 4-(cytidine 5'-diphospho)-2-C-methyl-D-erythritol kinase [Gemmatimonadales bacterium]|nr:MAG: 4-(cytidine 5'-diphospho)-2-C-methyl-D-erythritol kinase [Gemmatimonadales bacterium]
MTEPDPREEIRDRSRWSWSGEAPAKVNLFLRILAREETGFHQLETVYQTLELADRVELEVGPGPRGIRLEVAGVEPEALGPPDENLVVRAARIFLDSLDGLAGPVPPSLRIRLHKEIPHGAGLGGGSSDAATVLVGMNRLLGDPLPRGRLAELGGRLGSDVPFFLSGSSLALAWGRGDRLLALDPLPPCPVLLALPGEGMPTPVAYRVLAEHRTEVRAESPGGLVLDPRRLRSWDALASIASNDFEVALQRVRPELRPIWEAMRAASARPALLSGSGSAVFGVFEDEEALEGARSRLLEETPGLRLLVTRTRTRAHLG